MNWHLKRESYAPVVYLRGYAGSETVIVAERLTPGLQSEGLK